MASDVQTRTMPGCNSVCNKVKGAARVYKNRGTVLKVDPVTLVNFFTCLDWAVFGSFIVIQQMDAPMAQEKKRFEEIHRST
ncbi:hypothetical protein [Pseudomonas sp. C2B4]|uniref:hypothetical protein n=1 Tax=Pseudomonas sp. C2B4 TaxID=2735270 RepID=UPI00158686A8|nr:hypothetical protein [Pseudomonas sp. C2B4]NUU36965.1 hypothetical protein [Pseudomonas sp. C2B4]